MDRPFRRAAAPCGQSGPSRCQDRRRPSQCRAADGTLTHTLSLHRSFLPLLPPPFLLRPILCYLYAVASVCPDLCADPRNVQNLFYMLTFYTRLFRYLRIVGSLHFSMRWSESFKHQRQASAGMRYPARRKSGDFSGEPAQTHPETIVCFFAFFLFFAVKF